jgi:hypothetical protein
VSTAKLREVRSVFLGSGRRWEDVKVWAEECGALGEWLSRG